MPREQIYKETFVVIEVALVNLYQAHFFVICVLKYLT